jgi:hypothetical protein
MQELVERQLTKIEIRQRQVDHLRLLTEIDNYQSEIEEHQRCAKDAKTEIARLQTRERELRRELRSGTVWEARQVKLKFVDGSTDEPDEDTDPPGHPDQGYSLPDEEQQEHDKPALTLDEECTAWFIERYPLANDHEKLRSDLAVVLQNSGGAPTRDKMSAWTVGAPVFDAVAHWARIELAHMNASQFPKERIPARHPMPAALALALKPKAKRARRPKPEASFHGNGAVD